MSFIKGLLSKLHELPPEEHEGAIAEAIAEAKATPAEISAEITEVFSEVYGDGESLTSEAVDQLEVLGRVADGVDVLVQEHAARAARAQEIGQRIEGLKKDVEAADAAEQDAADVVDETGDEPAGDTPGEGDTTGDGDAPEGQPAGDGGEGLADDAAAVLDEPAPVEDTASAPAPAPELAPAPAPVAPEPVADDEPAAVAPAAESPASTPELVHASVNETRVPLGHTNTTPAVPAEPDFPVNKPSFSLVAAADIPGFSTGEKMDGLGAFARAWESRMFPMISGKINNGIDGERTRVGIARIRRDLPEEFVVQNDRDAEEVIKNACDETRLPGGSLVASAGWCAPSETLYDLCPIRMTQEGLISLPQVQTQRGGVRYPADFDWAAVWSSIGFDLTEEEVIAGRDKQCVEVPCPSEWAECRMDVSGLCIRTPILMERGWPERIAQFFEGSMLVHAHKMNARKLAKMEQLSERIVIPGPRMGENGGGVVDPHGPGAVESLLSILELQVQYQRYRDRLSQTQRGGTLELVAPYWLRGILKSDLRKKLGIDNRWSITDAQLDTYLRNVGVNPQYVYDWQDAFEHPMNASGFGGPIPLRWPDHVKLMLYPSGSFFELSDNVINLDGVYDHASLVQNVYTGLFTEEGWQVCRRCLDSYVIELDLCANGLSGSQMIVECDDRPAAPGGDDAALCATK